MTQQECAPSQLVPPHTYPNGSSSPETVPEHSASLHRNYGYASDLSKHSGTISGKLSSRRFRRGEGLATLTGEFSLEPGRQRGNDALIQLARERGAKLPGWLLDALTGPSESPRSIIDTAVLPRSYGKVCKDLSVALGFSEVRFITACHTLPVEGSNAADVTTHVTGVGLQNTLPTVDTLLIPWEEPLPEQACSRQLSENSAQLIIGSLRRIRRLPNGQLPTPISSEARRAYEMTIVNAVMLGGWGE